MTGPFRIFIRGVPEPKGSKRAFVVKGRAVTVDASPKTKPWERLIRDRISAEWEGPPLDGPIEMTLTFQLVRPQSVSAKKRPWPCVRPDGSKLQRAVEDALVAAGAINDDALIVSWTGQKVYGNEPGVEIEIRKL